MELIRTKAAKRRVSELFYLGLNACLPIAIFFLVRLDPPYLAILLIFLSKWRILALRPRFWWPNIKANMVDLLVGLSVVGLLYLSSSMLALQIVLTVAYAAWLLAVKPRSGAHGIMLQAGIAQFVSLVALFHFSILFPEFVVVLGAWLIGFVCARHVISNYEEEYVELLAAVWGLFTAQIAWLFYHWTIVYSFGLPVQIPQIAMVMLVVGFSAARTYHLHKHERLEQSTLRGNIIFGVALLSIILIFSPWDVTI